MRMRNLNIRSDNEHRKSAVRIALNPESEIRFQPCFGVVLGFSVLR